MRDREMEVYIVLLHLVSRKRMTFKDIPKLLGWEELERGFYQGKSQAVLHHIYQGIEVLRDEWKEEIPFINAFVFREDGNCTSWICETVFKDREKQPTARQLAEYAFEIATYENWDKVLAVFRDAAFQETTKEK